MSLRMANLIKTRINKTCRELLRKEIDVCLTRLMMVNQINNHRKIWSRRGKVRKYHQTT